MSTKKQEAVAVELEAVAVGATTVWALLVSRGMCSSSGGPGGSNNGAVALGGSATLESFNCTCIVYSHNSHM